MAEEVRVEPVPSSGTQARMLRRLARFGGPKALSHPQLEPLLHTVRSTHPKADTAVIERAYAVAERAHEGQYRKSGDAYITHPVAVATIRTISSYIWGCRAAKERSSSSHLIVFMPSRWANGA